MVNRKPIAGILLLGIALIAVIAAAGCIGASGDQTPVNGEVSHSEITKVADYLYEVTCYDYDDSKMKEYADIFSEHVNNQLVDKIVGAFTRYGGCSSAHVGDFYGRNLDLGISNNSNIVVHVPAKEGRYASVGVALICDESWTPEHIEEGLSEDEFTLLPFLTQDGINEKGVGVNCNYAPAQDIGLTTGTNPGKKDLPLSFIPRYVLDNAASAKEAVDLLSECNVYLNPFSIPPGELHFMICDPKETYIVEFIDNEMKVVKDNVMTNFYLSLLPKYTPQACGMERYDILKANIGTVNSVDTMDALMQMVQYTKAYNPATTPRWYSEIYNTDVTYDSPLADKEARLNSASEEAKTTTRKPHNPIWQTMHSSIYDLKNLTLKLHVQEDYEHSYEFHVPGAEEEDLIDIISNLIALWVL